MLPDKWYVLYADKKEFDILNTYYKKNWEYNTVTNPPRSGYTTREGLNNWVGGSHTVSMLKKEGFAEISFNQFRREVLKEYTVSDRDYSKCLKRIFKKLKIK